MGTGGKRTCPSVLGQYKRLGPRGNTEQKKRPRNRGRLDWLEKARKQWLPPRERQPLRRRRMYKPVSPIPRSTTVPGSGVGLAETGETPTALTSKPSLFPPV